MKKIEIRESIKQDKAQLSQIDVSRLSLRMLNRFSSLDFSSIKTIHTFLPIAEKKEPDTFVFIDWLGSHHPEIKIIVPKADFDTALMANIIYEGKETLVKSAFDILEPQKGELHAGDVDLVLVPMLAFDKRGFRVGYGKGFYDRFLQGINTKKIGLCLFEPVETIDDVNEYDVKLNACITPRSFYRFD